MAKQIRYINPNCHRPVPWNEKAVARELARCGYLLGQVKEDGIRFHAFLDDAGQVRIVTREGIEIRSLAVRKNKLAETLRQLPQGFAVDGEVVVQGVTFEEGSGLLRAYAELEQECDFYVWDAFPLVALLGDEYDISYTDRLNTLVVAWCEAEATPNVLIIEGETLHSMQEIEQYFETCRAANKEGAVVKVPDLPVIHGKRTGQWKLKPSETADGRITGLVWGTPGLGNAGKVIGFTVELESGVLCDVTGITQKQMDEFTAQVEGWELRDEEDRGAAHPFLGRYVEISYMEETAAGSLRHPSFEKFRDLEYAPGWKS